MKILFIIALYCCYINIQKINAQKSLLPIYEWKDLEYGFPSAAEEQSAITRGTYIRGNGVPIDVDVDYRSVGPSRVFITIPRIANGIPFTLGIVTGFYKNGNPIVNAYPDYYWNNRNDCSGIISVFRIAIDECHRLWILDTGVFQNRQICPPQLLVFDLINDRFLHRYAFPMTQYKPGVSLFITPIVDVRDPMNICMNTMVYIADVTTFGIIVFDLYKNKSWRVQHPYTAAQPRYSNFTIAAESFQLMDGIFGLALSPKNLVPYRDRVLYFHPLAGVTEYKVQLALLDDCTIWEKNMNAYPNNFVQIGTRETQSTAQAMDCYGNLFQGLTSPTAVSCWDSRLPYCKQNMKIVSYNYQTLQFSSGLKVVKNRYNQEELWVLTCRFQKIMRRTKNSNEVNFRIQALPINELLGGTQCNGASTYNYAYPYFP